jgi:hypothetical protein
MPAHYRISLLAQQNHACRNTEHNKDHTSLYNVQTSSSLVNSQIPPTARLPLSRWALDCSADVNNYSRRSIERRYASIHYCFYFPGKRGNRLRSKLGALLLRSLSLCQISTFLTPSAHPQRYQSCTAPCGVLTTIWFIQRQKIQFWFIHCATAPARCCKKKWRMRWASVTPFER